MRGAASELDEVWDAAEPFVPIDPSGVLHLMQIAEPSRNPLADTVNRHPGVWRAFCRGCDWTGPDRDARDDCTADHAAHVDGLWSS